MVLDRCQHTLRFLHGSGAQFVEAADHGEAAEPRGRERRHRVAVEKPREKMELITQKDQPGDEYIRTQNQKTDKAIDVTVVFGETVTQMQTMHRVGEGNLTSEFGSDLRYNERRHATFGERHSKGEFTSKSS